MRIGFIIFILIILGFLYLFFLSPVFRIKSFTVTPDEFDCGETFEVKKIISIEGQNFFSLDNSRIEKKIKDKFFCIGSLSVKKTFPDKVKLELNKRQGALNLIPNVASSSAESSSSGKIATESGYLVDKEGVIFSRANFETNLQPVLFDGDLTIGQKLGSLIEKIFKIIDIVKSLGLNATDVKIYSGDHFSTGLKPQIIFRLDDSLDRQLASLQLIINQAKIDGSEIDFLDLRFDKPVVRFSPKK